MDYIDVNQHLVNEQISQAQANLAHWEIFSSPDIDKESNYYRLYSDPFDKAFKEKFMDMLREDRQTAKIPNLSSEDYDMLFLKYLQMNKGQVYNVGMEYKNLYYRCINETV
ncbi:hypothetical protein [Dyadobacter sediminis]|uniref:Uncharacterized protein n=1 Tax=Dyadobacter sediminis TaxID=1493691 RepID=A0A5R9KK19_9BACT|nr:hypothetical protein [Dyadobacter sediminis]TLU96553.1 hypothetical protein FEM55_05325 [Dyadobacter sediminis]GGB83180.1 hypothetical protein GCM10011325_08410 [Dyadobacter sediminis]